MVWQERLVKSVKKSFYFLLSNSWTMDQLLFTCTTDISKAAKNVHKSYNIRLVYRSNVSQHAGQLGKKLSFNFLLYRSS